MTQTPDSQIKPAGGRTRAPRPGRRKGWFSGDKVLHFLSASAASSLIIMLLGLLAVLSYAAMPSIKSFGAGFLTGTEWRPNELEVPKLDSAGHIVIEDGETVTVTKPAVFSALPVIYGTAISSVIALLIAVPISIGTALFLVRLAPPKIAGPVSFLVEFLAVIPSIAYGIWGLFVLCPLLQGHIRLWGWLEAIAVGTSPTHWLSSNLLGWALTFEGTPQQPEVYFRGIEPIIASGVSHIPGLDWMLYEKVQIGNEIVMRQIPLTGRDMLAGGLVLAIMILPIITAVSRDVLRAVPRAQIEGTAALGATWWQTCVGMLRYSRSGLFGAVILGLARASGETMAITMVIGNANRISASLFAPAQTMSSLLANEFAEAVTDVHRAALTEVALILLVMSLLFNVVARYLVVGKGGRTSAST